MMRRPFTHLAVTWLAASALTGCEDTTPPTASVRPTTAQLDDVSVVDTTPPVITYTIDGTLGQNGWYTSDSVTVTFTMTDPESPAAPSYPGTCGTQTFYDGSVRASDGPLCTAVSAGGTSEVALDILLDRWPPDLTGPFTISPAASAPGWWNTDVSITYTCDDGQSGAVDSNPRVTVSTEGVNQPYTATCTDKAGNSTTWDYPFFPLVTGGSMTPVYISIDKTPPTLAPTVSPTTVLLNGSATASPNATDGLSGVASQSCEPVVTSSVGTRSVNCTATDSANNTVTKSVSYTVVSSLTGFVGLNAPPALNAARAKGSILVKFDLGGYRGLNVLAAGSPASQAISCVTMASTGLEAPTTGSLTYSSKSNLYTYDWRTDKAWVGTCRQLTVKLADGTERRANFQLK